MNEYDDQLKVAFTLVGQRMDDMSPKNSPRKTTTDAIQVHLNGFGRWVAKFQTYDGATYYAFGDTLLDAVNNLAAAKWNVSRDVSSADLGMRPDAV